MERHVNQAIVEYFANVALGSMPLGAHFVLSLFDGKLLSKDHPWTPELLFLTMTLAGSVVFSVFVRLFSGRLTRESLTFSCGILWIMSGLLAGMAALIYGIYAVQDDVVAMIPWVALVLAILSLVINFYLEFSIARATAQTEEQAVSKVE